MPLQIQCPGEDSTCGDRVAFLHHHIWKGHGAKMAQDVRCSTATISDVIHGKVQPGAVWLGNIVKLHPEVSALWLLTGVGEPFVLPDNMEPIGTRYVLELDGHAPGDDDKHHATRDSAERYFHKYSHPDPKAVVTIREVRMYRSGPLVKKAGT